MAIKAPIGIRKLDDLFCVCGDPGAAWDSIREYLLARKAVSESEGDVRKTLWDQHYPKSGVDYVFAYLMDHIGLTTHGGNVGGAWLESDGEDALEFLIKHSGKEWWDWQSPDFIGDDERE